MRGDYNTGTISGNTLLRVNDALNTYVAEVGILRNTADVNQDIHVGVNQNNYVLPYSGMTGEKVKFGMLSGSAFVFANLATPESAIASGVGGLCVNLNGGAGTTFFVKQSGTGNTGWVGK